MDYNSASHARPNIQNSGLVNANRLEYLTAKLALTAEDKNQAYTIRHDGYVSAGYIKPCPNRILTDSYDRLSSSNTIVLYKGERPAASSRICLLTDHNIANDQFPMPANEIFPMEIRAILSNFQQNRPARVAEITKLSRDPEFTKDNDLVFAMFRMVGYLILYYDVDFVLTTVRPSHVSFYRRLGFVRAAHPRPYPDFEVVVSLMFCTRESYDSIRRNVPIMGQLSKDDGIMSRFLKGEIVRVFPQAFPQDWSQQRLKSKTACPFPGLGGSPCAAR